MITRFDYKPGSRPSSEQSTGSARARGDAGARALIFFICAALSAAAVIPFFFIAQPQAGRSASELRMPVTHDLGLHYDQMRSFYEGLRGGRIYPRWEEDTNRGFGAPTTSYYPPAIYYLTSLMYALWGDWTVALMWAIVLIAIASGMAIYGYARRVMGRGAALVTMAAYSFLPYHMVDQYQRGAIAEMLGFVWMPLMLWGADELMRRDGETAAGLGERRGAGGAKLWMWVMVGVSYGMFVWSHPPTAYQFSLGYGMYVVVKGGIEREWRGVVKVAGAMVMGLGLSAAYLVPAALEQNLIRSDHIAHQYPYHDSYVLLFLRPNPDHYYAYLHLVDRIWLYGVIVILVAAFTLLVFKPHTIKGDQGLRQQVLLWVMLGCFASFMMTEASKPIGVLLPKIEIGVFAWRMLSIVTLVGALLAGACAEAALNAVKQGAGFEFALPGLVALLIVLGGAEFSLVEIVKPGLGSPAFTESKEHMNLAMQPRSSEADIFKLPVVDRAILAQGNGRVSIERWDPEHRIIKVELNEPDSLQIRTFNFPGWTAAIDGEVVDIMNGRAIRLMAGSEEETLIRASSHDAAMFASDVKPETVIDEIQLGDICIDLPQGVHRVTLDFKDTTIRRRAALVTLSSVCLLLALVFTLSILRMRN
jgi:Dolichyl-phosphate-mannose-protein mannosyltransferase